MKLIDPTAASEVRHNIRAPRLKSIDGLTVGLLSNGKANADTLLRETAAFFQSRHACQLRETVTKPVPFAPAPPKLIDNLAADVDILLTATGD